jgi:predicted PurR-regulated permease PerM
MTPAPKRRWFRWSLRTLFVVVTVAAVMAVVARPVVREFERARRPTVFHSLKRFPPPVCHRP